MYIVTLINGIDDEESRVEIHNEYHKLSSGTVVQGINAIDSCTFTINMANPGFDLISDFKTHVEVLNVRMARVEFYGRVLCSTVSMDENGFIKKDVTCESAIAYLCDSQQNCGGAWTHPSLEIRLRNHIQQHNALLHDEPYKHFNYIDLLWTPEAYESKKDESFWKAQKSTLELFQDIVKECGGELKYYRENEENRLAYVDRIGEPKDTEIALSKNMKAITKDVDPTELITRIIPIGAKKEKKEEDEEDEYIMLDGGNKWIDDEEAINMFGVHAGVVEFEDAETQTALRQKAEEWLKSNNKVPVKYSVTALDLSLLGLDIDDFEIGNDYPLHNALLNINDRGRIVKKNINLCDETKTTIELGTNFKSMSELQQDSLRKINASIAIIKRNYVLNKTYQSDKNETLSLINQTAEEITLLVQANKTIEAKLELKVGIDENDRIVSMLNASADIINIRGNRLTIESDNFTLHEDGTIDAKNGKFTGDITATSGTFRGEIYAANGGDIGGWAVTQNGLQNTFSNGGKTYVLRMASKPNGALLNRILSVEEIVNFDSSNRVETLSLYTDGTIVSRSSITNHYTMIQNDRIELMTDEVEALHEGTTAVHIMDVVVPSGSYQIYIDTEGAESGDKVEVYAVKF